LPCNEKCVYILVTAFVDFFIIPFKTSPAVKVIPKIIKSLHFFLGRFNVTQSRDGFNLGESRVAIKDRAKGFKEIQIFRLKNRFE
jgi:hypothetical protein